MNIGFIFTNFNNSDFSVKAVDSVEASDAAGSPILIVDNNSDDLNVDILKELEKNFENVVVFYNQANVGYFSGLNTALDKVGELYESVKYWVVGNNDLTFSECINKQVCKLDDLANSYPVISPRITTLDGEPQNPHVINGISKFREVVYDLYYSNFYLSKLIDIVARVTRTISDRSDEREWKNAQEIYQGYGACFILTPLFIKEFERLWAPTFLMYEEYFLSKQLSDKGYRIFYTPVVEVFHHCHASTGELPSRFKWDISRKSHKLYRKFVTPWNK